MIALVLLGLASAAPCVERGGYRDSRPQLSGPEQLVESENGRFLVHYTTEGADAPGGGDTDGDGTPDMIGRILDGLAFGDERFDQLGYRSARLDDGDGGSSAIDVYVLQIDANGYARPSPAEDGERNSCYIRLDPDLGSTEGQIVESVAIHELHHCVQYAYATKAASWIYEATATYEQYRNVSDEGLDSALGFLYAERLTHPERPIDTLGSRYEYAAFLVMKYWEEVDADPTAVPALWEALEDDADWSVALEAESQRRFGTGFDQAYLDHATWNAFACSRDDGQHYDPEILPCVFPVEIPVVDLVPGQAWELALEEGPYSSTYAELPAGGLEDGLRVSCGPRTGGAMVRVVVLDASGALVVQEDVELNGAGGALELAGPVDPAGRFLLVGANRGATSASVQCELERVPVPEPPKTCAVAGGALTAVPLLVLPVLLRRRRSDRSALDRDG